MDQPLLCADIVFYCLLYANAVPTLRLIYRDLKPENVSCSGFASLFLTDSQLILSNIFTSTRFQVGFNIRDDIVLFDFGLAREIHDKDKVTDNTWKMTGETGSIRYMAPEIASNKAYGKYLFMLMFVLLVSCMSIHPVSFLCTGTGYSADMYSFAIMLWEMLKMEKPFKGHNKVMHSELVVKKGGRPKTEDSWGPALCGFLRSCWNQDLNRRPTAAKASVILKREAAKVAGGSGLELNNFRRKSTFVNRNSLRERSSIMSQMKAALANDGDAQ